MAGSSITFASLILPAVGLVGAFITFLLEHPKDQYQGEISTIKDNRLSDVCNALGPIVSRSYDFARGNGDQVHEDLSSDNKATVAVTNTITPPDDVPLLKDAIMKFHEPEETYQRCRQIYFASYATFIISTITGAIPTAVVYFNGMVPHPEIVGAIANWISVIAFITGALFIGYFIYLNSKLDSMSESAAFSLG